MNSSKGSLRRIWFFMKGKRLHYVGAILLVITNVALQYVGPLISSWTIDRIITGGDMEVPGMVVNLVSSMGGKEFIAANLWFCALVLALITGLRGVCSFFQAKLLNTASEYTVRRIKDSLYSHIQNLPFDYHVKAETGDMVQRCTTDVETVRRFISGQLVELCRGIFMLLVAVFILGRVSLALTLLSLVLMPFAIFFSWAFHKNAAKQFKVVDEADGAMTTVLQENLTGVRVVRAFGRQEFERQKFSDAIDKLYAACKKLNNMFAFFWSFSDFTAVAQQALTLMGAMYFVIEKDMSYGNFLLFNSYIGMLIWPLRQLGRVLSDAAKMSIAMGRVDEILFETSEYKDETPQNTKKPPIRADIVFDGVSFSYDSLPVLKNVSVTAKAGETVASLGPTGSGKSTLVQLLQRLYDCKEGKITIGGVDIKEIDRHYLRSRVGIVLQEPFLYSRSIEENIGITSTTPEPERVREMAAVASVHDVIESFEEGYETLVGERGVTLSGGQKQRVAIARTLMKDNDVLIFDDSLSAVDTETDAKIREELNTRCEGITTFIISHRISTLSGADKIIVLEDGKISACVTHQELIEIEGMYKRIYEIQSMVETVEREEGTLNAQN
ncbi:MAG: ABC transporter ATP-binding protein [Clostridia bacterium]|nr:ABC transporter ATP-binding protein [Clostridia bacterium]